MMRSQNSVKSLLVATRSPVASTWCPRPARSRLANKVKQLGGSCELGANYAFRSEPSPVTRAGQLLDPGLYVGLAVSDQVVDLDVLWPVSDKPPATEASQANLEAR